MRCGRFVAQIAEFIADRYPGRTIAAFSIENETGSFTVTFTEGTVVRANVD